jgi:Mn-dependent DtxR family transcriptional regulator
VHERRENMSNTFMRVADVATELGISKSYAYKIVHRLNAELKSMGYLTVAGRVSKKYFMEKVCYGEHKSKERV